MAEASRFEKQKAGTMPHPKPISTFTEKGASAAKTLYLYEGEQFFPVKDFPLCVFRHMEPVTVPEHLHDFVEMVFVSKGRGIHQIKTLSAAREVVETFSYGVLQGDLFFLLPGETHCYKCNEELVLYNVLLSPELLAAELTDLKSLPGLGELFSNISATRQRRKLHLPLNSRLVAETLLNKVIEELKFQKPSFRLSAKSALLELLVFIGRMPPSAWERSTSVKDAENRYASIYKALTYMEQRLAEKLTLEKLASQAGLSLTYFCEQFKLVTGLSPWDYLTHLRLEKTKALLASTSMQISEIALQSGFCDSSYLAKTFKAHEGISPRDYRSRLSGDKT